MVDKRATRKKGRTQNSRTKVELVKVNDHVIETCSTRCLSLALDFTTVHRNYTMEQNGKGRKDSGRNEERIGKRREKE